MQRMKRIENIEAESLGFNFGKLGRFLIEITEDFRNNSNHPCEYSRRSQKESCFGYPKII